MIKEITDFKFNQLEVDNFNNDELQDILEYLCTMYNLEAVDFFLSE